MCCFSEKNRGFSIFFVDRDYYGRFVGYLWDICRIRLFFWKLAVETRMECIYSCLCPIGVFKIRRHDCYRKIGTFF